MDTLNEFPKVMDEARVDLAGNVAGKFSPDDWQRILTEAKTRLAQHQAAGNDETSAWRNVILDFHREKYWGFVPDWRPPLKKKNESNLGVRFIWMTFSAFIVTKIAVVWLGQIYTRSDDPIDAYLFFASIALVIFNFGFFLWSTRKYKD